MLLLCPEHKTAALVVWPSTVWRKVRAAPDSSEEGDSPGFERKGSSLAFTTSVSNAVRYTELKEKIHDAGWDD
jgi:hypothetical protein